MRRAFTLAEVLIAIALLVAMLGSIFTYFANLSDARGRAAEYADREVACALLIDRLEADLMTCLVGDATNGAGVKGDESSIRVLSRSVAAHLADRGRFDAGAFGDLQSTEYRFNDGSGAIEARRAPAGAAGGAGAFEPIGVAAKVRFRYSDGSSWAESFDSLESDRLPVAVEIAIWFHPWPGTERDDAGAGEASDREDAAFSTEVEAESSDELELDAELRFFDFTPPPDRIRVIAIPDSKAGEETDSVEIDERTEGEP